MRTKLFRAYRRVFCAVAFAFCTAANGQTHGVGEAPLDFATAQEAGEFLLEAMRNDDIEQLDALFGKEHAPILYSGNEPRDAENRKLFIAAAEQTLRVETDASGKQAQLLVGKQGWPFPIPLLRDGQAWHFDAALGKQELLNRRIGMNELQVLRVLRAYVQAQFEYANADHDADGIAEYAQKLASDPGTQNGLYWPVAEGAPPSPLGPLLANAQPDAGLLHGTNATPQPYHGYYYKILYRQGFNAPGGKYMYVINGNMLAGFALAAFPAHYGESGVNTYTINHQGEIYRRNLGAATTRAMQTLKDYDPDPALWQPVAAEQSETQPE